MLVVAVEEEALLTVDLGTFLFLIRGAHGSPSTTP